MASTIIKEFAHLQIPLDDILKATNNFADESIIGKGGFGNVYKGKLMRSGADELVDISARRLDRKQGYGDVEFWTEISIVSGLKGGNKYHVALIGFCDEKGEKIIINEHQAKGSLAMYVSNPFAFTWNFIFSVSYHIAEALQYIHQQVDDSYYIIHRNINSSTILLNDEWRAKLSGFEFSIKNSVDRMNQVFGCEAIGTRGYMDPAIFNSGGVTHKSDIYSFGVVLFELLCGRKAVSDDNVLLAPLAKHHYENGTLQDIIHRDIWNQIDPESLKCFSEVAYSCLEENIAQRPDANDILQKFSQLLLIQVEKHELQERKKKELEYFESVPSNFRKALQAPKKNELEEFRSVPSNYWRIKKLEHLRIELKDLQLATDNFSERYKISESMYNGYVTELECIDREYLPPSIEGKNIGELPKRRYTVRIMRDNYNEKMLNEIEIISSCNHRNIESFLGVCDEEPKKIILVYEFFSGNFLFSNLNNNGKLTWGKRVKLCIDIANGLHYLHYEMENQKTVIHNDISSSSIELGHNLEGKIMGFWKAVMYQDNEMYSKYSKYTNKTRETDVYSFGLLMIEILCGEDEPEPLVREWIDTKRSHDFPFKVAQVIMEENVENRSLLYKGPNKDSLDTFINIAYQCLVKMKNQRPTMRVVIKELEKALSFQENNRDPYRLSFEDIKSATKNFRKENCIGGGGFGSVYKGEFPHVHGNGHYTIVAKKLDTSHGQGETQFYNELQILYEYRHENVIGLVGYSNETDEKIIVYEHAPKGSLDRYLNDVSLTWNNRLKICIDFVTGLDFLHGRHHSQEAVIHRDIKAANILLFDDWKAKVGDFGLSLISTVNEKDDYVIDHACGTLGYLDPLYLKSGFLTIESDIYSFGVVLFEILCGRSTFETRKHHGQYLPRLIKQKFGEGKQDEMVFEAIKNEIVPKSLETFQKIAYKCLDDDREKRPNAKQILAQLKKALEFQVRPVPTTMSWLHLRLFAGRICWHPFFFELFLKTLLD